MMITSEFFLFGDVDFSIIYINSDYVRQGKLYLNELFKIESVLDLIVSEQRNISSEISRFKNLRKQFKFFRKI